MSKSFSPTEAELAKMPKWYRDAWAQCQEDEAAIDEAANVAIATADSVTANLDRIQGNLNSIRLEANITLL